MQYNINAKVATLKILIILNCELVDFGNIQFIVLNTKDGGNLLTYTREMGIQVKALITNRKTEDCK